MNFRVLAVVAGSLLIPSIGSADFVYTGVEVSYVDVELNNGLVDLDGDGYRFEGSVEMGESWFLLGEWGDRSGLPPFVQQHDGLRRHRVVDRCGR